MAYTTACVWTWAWLLAWAMLLTASHGLRVMQETLQTDTGLPRSPARLHDTPAKRLQRTGRVIGTSTLIFSQPLQVKTKPKDEELTLSDSPDSDTKYLSLSQDPDAPVKYIPLSQGHDTQKQYILPSQKAFTGGDAATQYILPPLKPSQGSDSYFQYIPFSQGSNSDPQYIPLYQEAPQRIETQDHDISLSKTVELPRPSQPGKESSEIGVSPNIKFYTLNCTSGKSCSTIIPVPTPSSSRFSRFSSTGNTKSPFSEGQVRRYLQQFSLRNGFPYNKEFELSGTPKEPSSDLAGRSALLRDPKRFLLDYSGKQNEQDHWWSGESSQGNPGKVYKYEGYRPKVYDWASVHASFPSRWSATETLQGLSISDLTRPHHDYPGSSRWPAINKPSVPARYSTQQPQNGGWRRYSSSIISQLDKDTGEWVQVSSSGPHIHDEVMDVVKSSSTKKQVHLTVLGVSDDSDGGDRGMQVVMKPSSLPGQTLAAIETDGGDDGDDIGGNASVKVQRKANQRLGRSTRLV